MCVSMSGAVIEIVVMLSVARFSVWCVYVMVCNRSLLCDPMTS